MSSSFFSRPSAILPTFEVIKQNGVNVPEFYRRIMPSLPNLIFVTGKTFLASHVALPT
jgi:hypothetical protein